MSFKTASDVARDQDVMEWQRHIYRTLNEIYLAHPGLKRCQANDKLIQEMVFRFLNVEASDLPMIAAGDFAISMKANYSEFSKSLVWTEPEEQKAELINSVLELLKSPDGTGRGGKHSNHDLKIEATKLANKTVEQIIKRRDEIMRAQALQKHSAEEIKEGLRQLHVEQAGPKALPPSITSEMLRRDVELLRKWVRIAADDPRLGIEAVNRRLQGKD